VQTFHPEHYLFQMVQSQDWVGFYDREIELRRRLGYPPFTRLALARIDGPFEAAVAREAQRLAAALKREVEQDGDLRSRVQVLGPAPAGLARLQGRYRWQLLLKSYGRPALATSLGHLRRLFSPLPRTRLNLTLDIDPNNLY